MNHRKSDARIARRVKPEAGNIIHMAHNPWFITHQCLLPPGEWGTPRSISSDKGPMPSRLRWNRSMSARMMFGRRNSETANFVP